MSSYLMNSLMWNICPLVHHESSTEVEFKVKSYMKNVK